VAMNLPSSRAKGRRAPMADINVTPLVDVMLVLLIIFMVTAPLMTAGVPVNLPDSRAKALDQDQKPVDIAVDRDGTIHIGEDAVTIEELPDRLSVIASERRQGDKPPQVFLRADNRRSRRIVAGNGKADRPTPVRRNGRKVDVFRERGWREGASDDQRNLK